MLHSSFLLFFLSLLPSFHPSLPHIHDPVINLVEISRSLINACPPSFPARCLILFRLYQILGIFFLGLLSVAFFSVFFADENEVMCRVRGVREEDWVGSPSIPSGIFSNWGSEGLKIKHDGLSSWMNSSFFSYMCSQNLDSAALLKSLPNNRTDFRAAEFSKFWILENFTQNKCPLAGLRMTLVCLWYLFMV